MSYSERQSEKLYYFLYFLFSFLLAISFFLGAKVGLDQTILFALLMGVCFGLVSLFALYVFEKKFVDILKFKKGYSLEKELIAWFEDNGFTCESSIETGAGDLDILVSKNQKTFFGIEAKNWSGACVYEDGVFILNKKVSDIGCVARLRYNCKYVRDKKFGSDSNIFIQPVVVFGHATALTDSINKVKKDNVYFFDIDTMKHFFKSI